MRTVWVSILAAVLAGCAPTHEKMWAELDRLELPEDYVLYSEKSRGSHPAFFGDVLEVRRKYWTEESMDQACRTIRIAGEAFSTGEYSFSSREVGRTSVCSVSLTRKGYGGGLIATSPPEPGDEPGPLTRVGIDVLLKAW